MTPTARLHCRVVARAFGYEAHDWAAAAYRATFPDDMDGGVINPASVYVAICPAPQHQEAPAARGVFPLLVESMMLWQYTVRHGRLPALNSSGGGHEVRPVRPCPDFDPALLSSVAERLDRADAAAALLHEVAVALGYAPTRRTWVWTQDDPDRCRGGRHQAAHATRSRSIRTALAGPTLRNRSACSRSRRAAPICEGLIATSGEASGRRGT